MSLLEKCPDLPLAAGTRKNLKQSQGAKKRQNTAAAGS